MWLEKTRGNRSAAIPEKQERSTITAVRVVSGRPLELGRIAGVFEPNQIWSSIGTIESYFSSRLRFGEAAELFWAAGGFATGAPVTVRFPSDVPHCRHKNS